MTHYLRLLAGLIGLAVLCLAQLATTAHAGISSAVLRVNLGVTVAPPAAPVTMNGSFTYGVTCIGTVLPQFVLIFPPPAFTITVNSATPITTSATLSTGAQTIAQNTCTFTQLTRPVAPAGFQWSGSPPDVVIPNIVLNDPPPVYAASFANLLVLPTVTAVASPLAGGTVTCTQPTTPLATSTCNATANPGFTFSSFITSSCGSQSSTRPFTTAPLSADCTVTAAFTPDPFVVTAVASPPAGGTISCTTPITSGNSSNCTVTANGGYAFTGVSTSSCGSPNATSPFSTAALTANCTVTAIFTPTYIVTAVANPTLGGTTSCTSPVISGATSSCTATANPNYSFTGFTTNNCGTASSTSPFVTAPVTANCTVTAAFSLNAIPVTTTVNIAAGGSVSCTPNPVAVGSTATCTVVTNAGYALTGVSGCGGATTTPGTFVTAPITAACSVAATFAPFVLSPSVPVPTLSGWMLILLTMFVVAIGAAICARRLS
jgi:Divergent InlB B-repeat domain